MKTKVSRKAKQLASALLTTLVICSIFSLFVMYYLSLIEQQNFLSYRSQAWNMAIAVTEAGIEDGLEQLNLNSTNLVADGWTAQGIGTYMRSNTLPDGNSYTVTIIATNIFQPYVISRSYVQTSTMVPQGVATILFATVNGSPGSSPSVTTRAVQVTCGKDNMFNGALIAKHSINLNGNGIMTDSFDSSDPTKSTNGQYDPAKYKGDKGDIASNGGLVDTLNVGNANIYGHAHTGSTNSDTIYVGPNGAVGSHTWQSSNKGIEAGWWLPDANFTFPDTTYPSTAGYLTPTGGVWVSTSTSNYTTTAVSLTWPGPSTTKTNYNTMSSTTPPLPGTYLWVTKSGTTYTWAVGIVSYDYPVSNTATVYSTNSYDHILVGADGPYTNYYTASDLSGTTYVTGSNVVLALPNGLNMSGGDTFTVGQGGNIVVYSGGTSCTIGGNGVLNEAGQAADFSLYAAPSVTSFSLGGNSGFTGVLVAPNANLSLNGGGSTLTDFYGSLMVNSVTMNGHLNFHYDEALSKGPANGRYLITAWNEVP
ncbi:MAG TPA: hypothetical protein VG146_07070 [Verrucomicrobiae bacterium]|nr:hypothetical protein [Verrucomicrobiae bacterium]